MTSGAGSTPDPGSSGHADDPTRAGGSGAAASARLATEDLAARPTVEGYVLGEELHRGGQGVVYVATQLGTKRQVALKVLLEGPLAGENARRRFEREVELAASLRHPNIVTILDSGLSRGRYYFAMELIEGVRLDRYVAQQRPTLDEALLLFERVCDAVNFAHQRGVIHRDLKPPNILVDADGEPHVLDFGLAKPAHPLAATESTVQMLSVSGQLLGTVAYMSPEQAAGAQDVDVRSDVYSLGVIFYEALTGQPPYAVDGPLGEILTRIAREEPASPRSVVGQVRGNAKIDDELATILLKCLEKEPARRYQTAGDLARDLRHRRAGEPIEAKRASGLYVLKKTLRRYRYQAATAGLILLMLVGFLITFAVLFTSERAARQEAVEKSDEARAAVQRQEAALEEARVRTAEAVQAQAELRRALLRQHIQRGDLALARNDLREARDSFWQAMEVGPAPAAAWALRRYYLQSAESGATILAFEPRARAASSAWPLARLSPDARWAAVCADADTVYVRSLVSAAPSAWVRAPGPVIQIEVSDEGLLAAIGEDWARVWLPGVLRPSVATRLPEPGRPAVAYPIEQGRSLLLVDEGSVRVFRGPRGAEVQRVALQGQRSGPPEYEARRGLLAVPTTAGVELVTLLAGGTLRNELAWTGPARARAVRFDGGELLGVLADAMYVTAISGPSRLQWTRLMDAAPEWELFDFKGGVGIVVLAARDGRLAAYRSGDRQTTWRCTPDRLEQLCMSAADASVATLDDRGVVTRWIAPERIEQRRQVYDAHPVTWASSSDGSTLLAAVARGQVVAYSSRGDGAADEAAAGRLRTILRPRLLGLGSEDVSLAVNGDGTRAVIRDRTSVRLVELADRSGRMLLWRPPARTAPDKVALSDDGQLAAVLVRSAAGDQERVLFRRWPASGASAPADRTGADGELAAEDGRAAPAPIEFSGALVREMAFFPQSRRLLVARSNGQLLLADPESAAGASDAALRLPGKVPAASRVRPQPELWLTLDAPPAAIAFSRTGAYLAAACEDSVLRLVLVGSGEIRHRIPLSAPVSALTFNPRDDVLLVRSSDGMIRLFDPATGEDIATWPLRAETGRPLAAWSGDDADAMLLGEGGSVYEYRYAAADAVIERNRGFARERRVARALADADFVGAWEAACSLGELDAPRGRGAQLAVLESALRRATVDIRPGWAAAMLREATSLEYARLGHAAYDGERFALAREWLRRAVECETGNVDALTLWRLAACDYLADAFEEADAGFRAALQQPDFNPSEAVTAALQRVAALWFGGRRGEAHRAALHIGRPDGRGWRGDPVAVTYAAAVARMITGIEREDRMGAVVDSLLVSVGERSLLFQDDGHFFGGELARQRGDVEQAAVRYQRCIDVARDTWPSNWARFRLAQLAPALARDSSGSE